MNRMYSTVVKAINEELYYTSNLKYERPEIRPWQYIQMEYERVGMTPPVSVPRLESMEEAQIWMCLDAEYNRRLRERSWLQAV